MLLRVFQNELMEHRLIVRDGFRREAMHLDGKARIRIHEGVALLCPCIAQRQRFLVPVKAELYAVLLQPGRIRKRQGMVPGNQNFHILDDRATRKSVESYLMMSFPEPPNNISRPSPPSR